MAKVKFTASKVIGFACPADKAQAFLWDLTAPGLGLRTTPKGKPAYIFQSTFQGKYIRLVIGSPEAWTIPLAQEKARELQRMIDQGTDPRSLKADAIAQTQAKTRQDAAQALTVGEAWGKYITARTPQWGTRHIKDHVDLADAGGQAFKRGKGTTEPGPLASLMTMRLVDLTAPVVEAWAEREGATRPTQARLSWRLLKAFLSWCAEQSEYTAMMPPNAAKSRKARQALGKPAVKADVLLREQLPAWFTAVRQVGNPVISAYLQTVLLTGARPGEVITLRWEDLNLQWRGITIRDKVEGERVIPLTPYVAHLMAGLPRRNEWVFSSPNSASGYITEPTHQHTRACTTVGLQGLTLHGLRRSFKSLTEWLEVPVGVVAQIQGHKPSATAEKHYTVRPLDLLRVHHEKIEAWILEQAGVKFDAAVEPGKLRVVAG